MVLPAVALTTQLALFAIAFAQTPTLAFLDDRDLTLTETSFKEDNPDLVIEVRELNGNVGGVELRVVGADLAAVLRNPLQTTGNTNNKFKLELANGAFPRTTVQGELVATSATGIARRKITLQGASAPRAGVELVERLDTLSLSATNYLPSLLNSPAIALFSGIGAGLVFWAWRSVRPLPNAATALRKLPTDPAQIQGVLNEAPALPDWRRGNLRCPVFLLVMVFGLMLLGIFILRWDAWVLPVSAVSIGWAPVHVTDHAYVFPPGPVADTPKVVGLVSAVDGSFGTVVTNTPGTLVTVAELPRAGRYDGQLGLDPLDSSKRVLKVGVNVADWWVYAAIALAVGVVFGYRVTRYYAVDIQLHRLLARAAKSWAVTSALLTPYKDRTPPPPALAGLTKALHDRITEVYSRLNDEDLATATTLLTAFDTYCQSVGRFLVKLAELNELEQRVREAISALSFDLDPDSAVTVLIVAKNFLDKAFEPAYEDAQGAYLAARITEIDTTNRWLEAARRLHALAVEVSGWPKLTQDQAKTLRGIGAAILATPTEAGLEARAKDLVDFIQKVIAPAAAPSPKPSDLEIVLGDYLKRRSTPVPAPDQPLESTESVPAIPQTPVLNEPVAISVDRWRMARRAALTTESMMTVLSGALAVASGLLLVYVTTPTWGSPGDYLKALLWGSVVSEGVKATTRVAARQWPFGG